jgi:hypothetical protein
MHKKNLLRHSGQDLKTVQKYPARFIRMGQKSYDDTTSTRF